MNKKRKSLLPQETQLDKRITIKDLPVEFVELSEEVSQQIIGGYYTAEYLDMTVTPSRKLNSQVYALSTSELF
jgi:hypothetical protein